MKKHLLILLVIVFSILEITGQDQDGKLLIRVLNSCDNSIIPNIEINIQEIDSGYETKLKNNTILLVDTGDKYQISRIKEFTWEPSLDKSVICDQEFKIDTIFLTPSSGCVGIVGGEYESAFTSAQSITIITRDEIAASSALTIEELLMTVPGMIIRQQTNGNYDIHIRGNDNIATGSLLQDAANSFTLVMIDGRIIYNYMTGGTFWETLPININDIEQIEVIRGPASTLYGANAATGAINIVTRKIEKEKSSFYVDLNTGSSVSPTEKGVEIGTPETTNIMWGGHVNNVIGKSSTLRFSGYYQSFGRFQEGFYSYATNQYVSPDSILFASRPEPRFLDSVRLQSYDKAREGSWATNISYISSNDDSTYVTQIDLGYQNSDAKVAYVENLATPFSHRTSSTGHLSFSRRPTNFEQGDFTLHGSIRTGSQDLNKGTDRLKYNLTVAQASSDFKLLQLEREKSTTEFKVGTNYQGVVFEGLPSEVPLNEGREFFKESKFVHYLAPYARIEQSIFDSPETKANLLKATLGVRWDFFLGDIKDAFPTFQFFLQSIPSPRTNLRMGYSRARRTHFFLNNFLDFDDGQIGETATINSFIGNNTLEVPIINNFEIGIRNQLIGGKEKAISVYSDVELFFSNTNNYQVLVPIGADTNFTISPPTTTIFFQVENSLLRARQIGFTTNFDILYNLNNSRIKARVFATIQNTTTEIADTYSKHEWTPDIFGGISFSYLSESWTISLNSYYTGEQLYNYHAIPQLGLNDRISSRCLTNFRISYKPTKFISTSLGMRNLFSKNENLFGFTDTVTPLLVLGLRINL